MVELPQSRPLSFLKHAEDTVPSLADWEKDWQENSQRNVQPKLLPVEFQLLGAKN
jgi:hypothetical protein